MYVISCLVLVLATPYTTHLRSLLPVMYVISSLDSVSSTPYTTHLRSLLHVMYVISRDDTKTKLLITYITCNNGLRGVV
jgi:hypothetical protein